jgi:hypothetical protein
MLLAVLAEALLDRVLAECRSDRVIAVLSPWKRHIKFIIWAHEKRDKTRRTSETERTRLMWGQWTECWM